MRALFSVFIAILCPIKAFVLNGRISSQVASSLHLAKKPPISLDLEALEALEAQMDAEDELARLKSAKNIYKNDDGDLDGLGEKSSDWRYYQILEELDGMRIDAAISILEPEQSRSFCGDLVSNGNVFLLEKDSKKIIDRKSFKVQTGMELEVNFPVEEKSTEITPQDIPLDILYEDEHMIVINKQAGMVVHPAAGNWDGTVVNALAYHLATSPLGSGQFSGKDFGIHNPVEGFDGENTVSLRPGIVHRLDKGTSGVLVVAKTSQALTTLSESFAARRVKKTYLAITVGNPGKMVKIDKPIERHPLYRQRMRVVPDPHKNNRAFMEESAPSRGRHALSYVDTLAFDGKLSLVQVRIETGRTHQIRVHLQDRHTPIYGDDVYGLGDWNKRLSKTHQIERPLLHAFRLELEHPVSGDMLAFEAPLPPDMLQIASIVYPQGKDERPDIFHSSS